MSTGPRRLGKYQLQECLEQGGMAEVWKALDSQLGRYVALKLLHADLQADPDFLKRFEREAQMVAALHHPNIVKIYDFQVARPPESDSPLPYMVMDYVEGTTLAAYINSTSRTGRFPPPADIVNLFASISMAVDYAHRQGMIHRDLKPANILLDKRNAVQSQVGEPILTDFGLAKLLGYSTGTQSGSWIGTPLYISPEQAMGSPGNERSDIYALGVILYEICTGALPFQGNTSLAIMQQHINVMPTSPALLNPGIRPALSMVILRCLAKDPAARFPNATSLTAALAQAFNMPIPAKLDVTPYPVDPTNEPTYFKPLRPTTPQTSASGQSRSATPSSSSPVQPQQVSEPVSRNATVDFSLSPFNVTPPIGQGIVMPPASSTPVPGQSIAMTPTPGMSGPISVANQAQSPSPMLNAPTTLPPVYSPPPASRWRKPRNLFILLLILLVVFAGLGLSSFFFLSHQGSAGTPNPLVGHAYFVSSGQGIDDELLVDMHGIASSTPGKSYYAWLLSDKNQSDWHPILLGVLPVAHGAAHYLYKNPQHTNLLGLSSRFLITEEDANIVPTNPSPTAWRYYAEFPQSILSHMRYLLVNDPMIQEGGGLDTWLFRNTIKVLEWAGSARGYWLSKDTTLMHLHFIRILEYLDGPSVVGTDVSSTIHLPIQPPSVALLGSNTPGSNDYLHAIGGHVTAIAQSPDATAAIRTRTYHINTAINNVRSSLQLVYQDAKDLLSMTNTELLQPQGLAKLNDLDTQAFYAYVGQLDPTTNQVEPGVVQLHYDIQLLANFDVTTYKSQQ